MDSVSEKLRNLFGTLAAILAANPLLMLGAAVFVGVIVVSVLAGGVFSNCNARRTEEKKNQLNTNITTGKVEANVAQNKINEQANSTNQAANNFNNILNVPSNQRDGNYGTVRAKYCAEHPNELRCRP